MTIPARKAEYRATVNERLTNAYNVAMPDYLKGGEIKLIDVSSYRGCEGDPIFITAIDNFRVESVRVEIRSSAGELF
jgi:hypothetical protein